ncbi:nuclear transport factor 2 family protein [Chitinophaga sp.]|uniref:nuclear transport factor 2 family protein n=1 Tax=Chitinophaga sp. TaxID=1869181 RepID=UPI00262CB3AB|nr:nuclear transport factor 2 family protein [uncultured Chitinophaga sp.]
MKKLLSLFVLLACCQFAQAQSKDEKDVAAAVSKLRAAMLDADKTALEALTGPALTYGHSNARLENRAEFVDYLVSGKGDFVTMELSDQTIVITGNTAIVRHTLKGDTNDGGKPGKVHLHVMTVWVKSGKDWKLIGRQAVKVPPAS